MAGGTPRFNPINQEDYILQGGRSGAPDTGTVPVGTVLVLDDDPAILTSLERLLSALGFVVWPFASPEQLFAHGEPLAPACLLLDNQLGESVLGVDVYAEMRRKGWEIPTVFITAHWDVRLVVEVMRAGADGFVTKPYDPAELVEAVRQALKRSAEAARTASNSHDARAKVATLTSRERDVVTLVAAGLLNKEIADRLNIALVTVKVHRGRAMRKLGARNPAELSLIAAHAGLVE